MGIAEREELPSPTSPEGRALAEQTIAAAEAAAEARRQAIRERFGNPRPHKAPEPIKRPFPWAIIGLLLVALGALLAHFELHWF